LIRFVKNEVLFLIQDNARRVNRQKKVACVGLILVIWNSTTFLGPKKSPPVKKTTTGIFSFLN